LRNARKARGLGGIGRERQAEIYFGGGRGQKPAVPVAASQLEARARAVMSREDFAYVAGGAGLESTIAANRAAFERWRIVPRLLHDVAKRDCAIELFSRRLDRPFLLAPIGVLEAVHRDADLAVARAAAPRACR
jgi:lactate 2-monooxygenase